MSPDEESPESVSTGVNWAEVEKAISQEEELTDECGNRIKALYLGSVFTLTPSGKYYTPWATGDATPEEADADGAWWEAVEEQAHQHGLEVALSEADPTDILVIQYVGENGDEACKLEKKEAANRRRPHL
jgi:hypothetical protein